MVPLLWVTLLKCHRGHHNGLPQKRCLTLLFSFQLTSRTIFSSPLQTGTISAGGWLWLGTKECFPNLFSNPSFITTLHVAHEYRKWWKIVGVGVCLVLSGYGFYIKAVIKCFVSGFFHCTLFIRVACNCSPFTFSAIYSILLSDYTPINLSLLLLIDLWVVSSLRLS